MNFIFVNPHASAPEFGSHPYRAYFMAKQLVRLGHEVTIVTGSYSHMRSTQPKMDSKPNWETHDGINYVFLPVPVYDTSILSRIRHMFGFVYSYFKSKEAIRRQANPNVILEGTTFILPIYISRMIAKKNKALLLFEVRDLWPLSPIELSGASKYNPLFVLIGIALKYALRKSDYVLSTLRHADEYFKMIGAMPKRYLHIQNGFDIDFYTNIEPIYNMTYYDIKDITNRFSGCIGYTGSMGIANGVESLVDAAKLVKANDIAVVLIGSGIQKSKFRERAKAENITNLFIFDSVDKPEIIAITKLFDLGFCGGKKRKFHKYGVSPNKIFDYMVSAVPVLFCINTEDNIIENAGCGITVSEPTGEIIAETAVRFFNLPEERKREMGRNGRRVAMEKYEYKTLTKRLLAALDR